MGFNLFPANNDASSSVEMNTVGTSLSHKGSSDQSTASKTATTSSGVFAALGRFFGVKSKPVQKPALKTKSAMESANDLLKEIEDSGTPVTMDPVTQLRQFKGTFERAIKTLEKDQDTAEAVKRQCFKDVSNVNSKDAQACIDNRRESAIAFLEESKEEIKKINKLLNRTRAYLI